MQPAFPLVTPPQVRITPRDTFYRAIDPDTGLGLRVRRDRLSLVRADICTWFTNRTEAEQLIAARIGASTLEVIRHARDFRNE